MALEEQSLAGFRGGFAARRAPLSFGKEQWSRLHGFVVEDGAVLRTQWPLQHVDGITDVVSMGIYQGPGETPFLIAIDSDNAVWWRQAPPDSAETGSDDLGGSWNRLLDEAGSNVTVSSGMRPLVTVPLEASQLSEASGGLVPALIINSIEMGDSDEVLFVYEADDPASEAQRLRAMTLGASAMWPVDDKTEASPKAEHAVLWSGVLVLGDIEWKADPDVALSSSNKTRYRNGLWLSVAGEPLLYDPLSVLFIGEPSTRISGLVPTEQGLLVFTTSLEGLGGVHILRGTPDAYTLEPLHVGIGITSGQTKWQDTNTVCWITNSGAVWQTDTSGVRRLDRQGLGVDRQSSPEEGVVDFGPWLIAMRERRLFALRALDDGQTAAWTELNVNSLPDVVDMRYAQVSGQSLYLLSAGQVFRFTRADIRTGDSERGLTPSGLADLSVGSRTLATGEGHHKTFWHRVGLRATAGRRGTDATVERLILRAGPVLDVNVPSLTRTGPWGLAEELDLGDAEDTTASSEFTETWTATDHASDISADHTWDVIQGSFALTSNEAVTGGSSGNEAILDDSLSGVDQYAKVTVDTLGGDDAHVLIRNPGTGTRTHYRFVQNATGATVPRRAIERVVDGFSTVLASEGTGATAPFDMELRAEGSRLVALIDDVEVLETQDSVIESGRYAGIGGSGAGTEFDDFESGLRLPSNYVLWAGEEVTWDGDQVVWDTSLTGVLPDPTHSPKRWQGIVRGIGTSGEFSVEAVFQGDVEVEQLSVFYNGSIRGGTEEGY